MDNKRRSVDRPLLAAAVILLLMILIIDSAVQLSFGKDGNIVLNTFDGNEHGWFARISSEVEIISETKAKVTVSLRMVGGNLGGVGSRVDAFLYIDGERKHVWDNEAFSFNESGHHTGNTKYLGSYSRSIPRGTGTVEVAGKINVSDASAWSGSSSVSMNVKIPALAPALDLNGRLNGVSMANIAQMGTCDIYVAGNKEGENVTDLEQRYENGSSYIINDIRPKAGYQYAGASTVSGTLSRDTDVYLDFLAMVTYDANHGGPGGAASTAATLKDPHGDGLIIDQSGIIKKNGEDLYTAGARYNLEDIDDPAGIDLEKKGYHIEAGEEWNTKADGTGTSYDQSVVYPASEFMAPKKLYANWKPNEYTLTYRPNAEDAGGAMPDQTVVFDAAARVLSNAYIRDGYRLRGWDRDPDADPAGSLDIVGNNGVIPSALLEDMSDGSSLTLYAIWRPILASEADIYIGKIMKPDNGGVAQKDVYEFRIEAVEGMRTDNASTGESGQAVSAEDMPMPEGTPAGSTYKDVELAGMSGNVDLLRTESAGLINFEEPGWYMYRISEIAGAESNIIYDRSSYYVVCYVRYKEDTGWKVEVSDTTAWHNRNGMSDQMPNLDDLSSTGDVAVDTDRDGIADSSRQLLENTEGVYGKTGAGRQSVLVRFWNEERGSGTTTPVTYSAGLHIVKNLKGNLGDRTKGFEYTVSLSGLSSNTTYAVENHGAEPTDGLAGNGFTTDDSGRAVIGFRLRDDESLFIGDLPHNAYFNVTENGSDHRPGYRVFTGKGDVKKQTARAGSDLSTGNVMMSQAGEVYTVIFDNYKELAVNTGLPSRGLPTAGITALLVLTAILLIYRIILFFR